MAQKLYNQAKILAVEADKISLELLKYGVNSQESERTPLSDIQHLIAVLMHSYSDLYVAIAQCGELKDV